EIGIGRECEEFCPDCFDALAQGASGKEYDFVALPDQAVSNRQKRVEMTCCGRRTYENFHITLLLRTSCTDGPFASRMAWPVHRGFWGSEATRPFRKSPI